MKRKNLRRNRVPIKFTDSELQELDEMVRKLGLKRSSFIRLLIRCEYEKHLILKKKNEKEKK